LHGICNLEDGQFSKYVPEFYSLFSDLMLHESSEIRQVLKDIMSRVGGEIQIAEGIPNWLEQNPGAEEDLGGFAQIVDGPKEEEQAVEEVMENIEKIEEQIGTKEGDVQTPEGAKVEGEHGNEENGHVAEAVPTASGETEVSNVEVHNENPNKEEERSEEHEETKEKEGNFEWQQKEETPLQPAEEPKEITEEVKTEVEGNGIPTTPIEVNPIMEGEEGLEGVAHQGASAFVDLSSALDKAEADTDLENEGYNENEMENGLQGYEEEERRAQATKQEPQDYKITDSDFHYTSETPPSPSPLEETAQVEEGIVETATITTEPTTTTSKSVDEEML